MKIPEGLAACLVFALIAVTASAGDDTVVVASVGNNLSLRNKAAALPPLVTERYEYYDIHGSCENDLLRELRRKGVAWEDGKRYESVTNWHVKWNYGHTAGAQTCSADSFQVAVDIVFRYPNWTRTEDAPPTLAEKWDAYMQRLIMHENEHRDMAVEAAAELSRAVSEMSPAQTCVELDQAVRALSYSRMNKLNDDERHYDEATNHGALQGAIFR